MDKVPKFQPDGVIGLSHGFLSDDPSGLGDYIVSKIHEDYSGRLDIFERQGKGKPYAGSSTLGLFAVDDRARQGGARVMLPKQTQFLIEEGIITKGTYEDLGASLDFSGNDHELAVWLYDRLNKEDRDLDRFPVILTDLATVVHGNTKYGLALEPGKSYPYGMITAKILARKSGNFEDSDPNLKSEGLPSSLGSGQRVLYTNKQNKPSVDNLGLSRFCLSGGLGLNADVSGLAVSGSGGRVVLVGVDANQEHVKHFAELRRNCVSELEILKARIEKEIAGHKR